MRTLSLLAWPATIVLAAGYYADPMRQPFESPINGRLIIPGLVSMAPLPPAHEVLVGLFRRRTYTVRRAMVRRVVAHSAYTGEGPALQAATGPQPIFFLKGYTHLAGRWVATAFDGDLRFTAETKLTLSLPSEQVALALVPNGKIEKDVDGTQVEVLQLQLTKGEKQVLLPLVDTKPEISNQVRLIWAGDLDGDNRIDLLFHDFAYESGSYRLFLSTAAKPGAMLGEVGQHYDD